MASEHYMNQPMQSVELGPKLVIAENPQMINSLDQNKSNPLIRQYSHIPFNK